MPKMYGGTSRLDNIVRCCLMCNSIKGARLYEWVVPFFPEFLEVHREEYSTANPDDWATIGAMTRIFNAWLHALQHAPRLAEETAAEAHAYSATSTRIFDSGWAHVILDVGRRAERAIAW